MCQALRIISEQNRLGSYPHRVCSLVGWDMSQIIPQINAKCDKSQAGRHARLRRGGKWGVTGAPWERGWGHGRGGLPGRGSSTGLGAQTTAGGTRRSGWKSMVEIEKGRHSGEAGKLKRQPASGLSKVGNYRGGWGCGGHPKRRPWVQTWCVGFEFLWAIRVEMVSEWLDIGVWPAEGPLGQLWFFHAWTPRPELTKCWSLGDLMYVRDYAHGRHGGCPLTSSLLAGSSFVGCVSTPMLRDSGHSALQAQSEL